MNQHSSGMAHINQQSSIMAHMEGMVEPKKVEGPWRTLK